MALHGELNSVQLMNPCPTVMILLQVFSNVRWRIHSLLMKRFIGMHKNYVLQM